MNGPVLSATVIAIDDTVLAPGANFAYNKVNVGAYIVWFVFLHVIMAQWATYPQLQPFRLINIYNNNNNNMILYSYLYQTPCFLHLYIIPLYNMLSSLSLF